MKNLKISAFKYEVIAYDNNEYLGKHLSTSATRYEAKKNMIDYLKCRGYRGNITVSVKSIKN
jgi:hypothetical protein